MERIAVPSRTAAQVSSQSLSDVSIAQDQALKPHDQRVLAVVVVVAATRPGGAEAESLVHRDRLAVRHPDLERERQLVARLLEELPDQARWRSRRAGARARRRRSSDARPGRSASRPGSRAARRRRWRRGRCPTASRARARTSPATTASGTSAARSRSPRAGRCRRGAGSAAELGAVQLSGVKDSRSRQRSASGALR